MNKSMTLQTSTFHNENSNYVNNDYLGLGDFTAI